MSSSSKLIFTEHLLLGERIKLLIPTHEQLRILLGCLRVYKSRYEEQLRRLGMEEDSLLKGQVISHLILEESSEGLTVEIFTKLEEPKTTLSFKVLE